MAPSSNPAPEAGHAPHARGFRLDSGPQTLLLWTDGGRLPEVAYWGPRLPADADVAAIRAATRPDITGGMLDVPAPLSVCPTSEDGFPGQPGLRLRGSDGRPLAPRLRLVDATEAADGLTLLYADAAAGLRYVAQFRCDDVTGVIEAGARIESDDEVWLDWLAAPAVPGPQLSDGMIDVSGRWCGEFALNRLPWTPGARLRDNPTGRTGHEHFPGLVMLGRGVSNCGGEAWGLHYGWSGGHRMIAEELPDGRRQVQFGHATASERRPARRHETATLYLAYSDTGLNGCAVAFQRHVRDRIVTPARPAAPRPVHYNCWEAVYFDHRIETLAEIADRAAALGAERFVLDDGWFGRRDDDRSSLGDWRVDARKYPDGLAPLIDHVRGLGMSFGLWFEPEMVSPDSDLFRAHPDWVLGPADQVPGRAQFALDVARAEVRDHIHACMSAILSAHDIDYVKWDHNRVLPFADAAQTRGSYAMIDRLRAEFPHVEIESCASGGGRIDFGVLRRTQRVWLSDSNDALERMRIQHDAALFLPAAVTGSHVGPRRCHTSGRVLDMSLRAWVAAQRHMGFEMDPRELTPEECRTLSFVTRWWKANRDWMMAGDILRLDSPDPAILAEQQLARDGSRFVVFAGRTGTSAQIAPRPLRLTGLDPDAHYAVSLLNRDEAPALSRGRVALKDGTLRLSGRYLMAAGLVLPWSFPASMWVVEGTRL